MRKELHQSKKYYALLWLVLVSSGFVNDVYAQCTPRTLPFTENFSVTPFATCTPTVGGWVATSAPSGAGWWLPNTSWAGGTAPEVEAYGDQANGGQQETVRLTSPPLNTTAMSACTLTFKHSLYLTNSGASGGQSINIKLDISQDSIAWTNFYDDYYNATPSLTQVASGTRVVNITGLAGNKMYLRFSITGVLFKVWGWEIDNINVTGSVSTQVPSASLNEKMIYHDFANQSIVINLSEAAHADAALFDILGNTIWQSSVTNHSVIDVSTFSKGIYFLKMENQSATLAKKIILD